jgi:hypothetical protein
MESSNSLLLRVVIRAIPASLTDEVAERPLELDFARVELLGSFVRGFRNLAKVVFVSSVGTWCIAWRLIWRASSAQNVSLRVDEVADSKIIC